MKVIIISIAITFLCGCDSDPYDSMPVDADAFVPIYADTANTNPVAMEATRPISNPGKIYVYGNYIFQNEQNEGIHIIDNSDPSNPVKRSFLAIPFNTEMAIRSNHVYANSINDLLVINMVNPFQPIVVNKIKNAFPLISQTFPPEQGLFVCPDPSKGIVIAWKLERVKEAFCRR